MAQLSMFDPSIDQPKTKYEGTVIYETSGNAREYRELACNLYTGCDHRCIYCYAPIVLQRDRKNFHNIVIPRVDILKKLEKDARKYSEAGETRQVLFCFTCDPYCKADVEHQLTRKAITICHNYGMNVSVLTKGGTRALRDIDLFTPQDSFATTLTTLDDAESLKWEPDAALPAERLSTLKAFHAAGIPTWVSLEPVLDPGEVLGIIWKSHEFVDEYKVGTLNYHPHAKTIDWRKFSHDVVALLEKLGCKYYIKNDLKKYMEG
ncbi:MAG: radical SAM protein [Anaerolineaceae bacterium]|nr:radical SAM protein [Anaerolineaceae bacterium]